jgi:hypothetical protein
MSAPLDRSVTVAALFQRSVLTSVRPRLDCPNHLFINLSHMRTRPFVMGVSLLAAALPTFVHHSFAAEFDQNKTVTLKGSVTEEHSHLHAAARLGDHGVFLRGK